MELCLGDRCILSVTGQQQGKKDSFFVRCVHVYVGVFSVWVCFFSIWVGFNFCLFFLSFYVEFNFLFILFTPFFYYALWALSPHKIPPEALRRM
jgi:hypothetical protein